MINKKAVHEMEEDILGLEPTVKAYRSTQAEKFDIYIGEIGAPETFYDTLFILSQAREEDEVILHINSPGGYLNTTTQLMNAISKCAGMVIASLEGSCCSGATMLFLACNSWEVQPNGLFMIHSPSGGIAGKHHEVMEHAEFDKRWMEAYYPSVYKHFLSPAEIKSVLDGKDLYFTSDEVSDRLRKTVAARNKEYGKAVKTNGK